MIYLYLLFYALILFYGAITLGVGPNEAKILFSSSNWLHFLELTLYSIYPKEWFIRVPVIVVTLINVWLYYLLSLKYLKNPQRAFLSASIFSLLPAVIGAGVIVNKAPFLVFLTLIFLFLYQEKPLLAYIFALAILFVDQAFAILFLSLSLYEFYKKEFKGAIYFFLLFLFSLLLFKLEVSGKPQNYFLDTFLIFTAIFSPLLFIYYFYVIYRIFVKEKKNLIWFISATSFLFALFLSFRQKIYLVDFAPFAVIGTVLMVKAFFATFAVRLKKFRKKLLAMFIIVMGTLLINDFILIFNRFLFNFLEPTEHFAYRYYLGKSLSNSLKELGVECVEVKSLSLELQLLFYGIKYCPKKLIFSPKGAFLIKFDGVELNRFDIN